MSYFFTLIFWEWVCKYTCTMYRVHYVLEYGVYYVSLSAWCDVCTTVLATISSWVFSFFNAYRDT